MSTAAEASGYRSSATARAALYRELLPLGLDPERINYIPGDVLDAMAAKYEPVPAAEPVIIMDCPLDGELTRRLCAELRVAIRRCGGGHL